MNRLEEFHARRRTASITIVAIVIQQSFLLGSSVVAGALLKAYTPGTTPDYPYFPREIATFEFHGLYALVLSLLVSYVVGAEVIVPITKKKPEVQPKIAVFLASFVPVAFLLGGVSSSIGYNVPLMYVAFAAVLGLSLALHDVVSRLETMQWWAVDGNKRVGVGIVGLTAGLCSIFYTLITGWILNYSGSLAVTLYCLFGIQVPISGWIVYAIMKGKLDSPPKPEDVKVWMDEAMSKDGVNSDEETPKRLGAQKDKDMTCPDKPANGNTEAPTRPHGTSASIPRVLKDRKEAFSYPVFYINSISSFLTAMNGYATKVLLSSMFELVFNLPLMTSTYLSALSLLLFVAARGIFPYYFLDSKFSGTSISIVAALLSCISYASLPTIVGQGITHDGGFSWRLVGFVVVKSVIGSCFAILSSVKTAIGVDLYGVANLRMLSSLSWDVAGVGGTFGPIMAFTTTMARYYGGMEFPDAFALFFYIAAGMAFVNTILYVFLHRAAKKN